MRTAWLESESRGQSRPDIGVVDLHTASDILALWLLPSVISPAEYDFAGKREGVIVLLRGIDRLAARQDVTPSQVVWYAHVDNAKSRPEQMA